MAEETEERSLGDGPASAVVADVTPEQTPEGFDFGAFLDGVRPTRRSVKVFPKGHLIGRMEEIAYEIDQAPDDADVDGLIDEYEALKADFNEGIWFTFEQRSKEWETKFRADTAKSLKVALDDEGNPVDEDDLLEVIHRQLAAQIVAPEGVTVDGLRRIAEASPNEYGKLCVAMRFANDSLAEKSQVLTRDFSRRRSTSRTTRPS